MFKLPFYFYVVCICTCPSFLYLSLMFESRSVCLKQNKAKNSADVSQDSFSDTSQEKKKITVMGLLIGFRRKYHTIQGLCLEKFLLKQAEIWEKQFLCHKVNVEFPPNTSSKQMEGGCYLFGLLVLVHCECLSKVCWAHRLHETDKCGMKSEARENPCTCVLFKVLQGATALIVRRSLWEMLVSLRFQSLVSGLTAVRFIKEQDGFRAGLS